MLIISRGKNCVYSFFIAVTGLICIIGLLSFYLFPITIILVIGTFIGGGLNIFIIIKNIKEGNYKRIISFIIILILQFLLFSAGIELWLIVFHLAMIDGALFNISAFRDVMKSNLNKKKDEYLSKNN